MKANHTINPVYPVYDIKSNGITVEFTSNRSDAADAYTVSQAKDRKIFSLNAAGIRTQIQPTQLIQ